MIYVIAGLWIGATILGLFAWYALTAVERRLDREIAAESARFEAAVSRFYSDLNAAPKPILTLQKQTTTGVPAGTLHVPGATEAEVADALIESLPRRSVQ